MPVGHAPLYANGEVIDACDNALTVTVIASSPDSLSLSLAMRAHLTHLLVHAVANVMDSDHHALSIAMVAYVNVFLGAGAGSSAFLTSGLFEHGRS
jgi:hypothetical protein